MNIKTLLRIRKPTKGAQADGTRGRHRSRAQSLIETALIFPVLLLLLGVLVDAGLGLNAWLRVNTAARDATRFALDAGRNSDITALVSDKLQNFSGDQLDIYVIKGRTSNSGLILDQAPPYWGVTHIYGPCSCGPSVSSDDVVAGLNTTDASNNGANDNVVFAIVEVDLQYSPLLPSLISPGLKIPMTSYAIVQTAQP